MLDADEIETVLTMAEVRNLSKAAEVLFVGQPTLSKRLNHIEDKLGYPVFLRERGKTVAELTPQGAQLLPILERIRNLNRQAAELGMQGGRQTLRLASSDGPYLTVIDHLVARICARESSVGFDLRTLSYPACIEAVSAGGVDLALVGSPVYRRHVSIVPLYRERMVLICPAGCFSDGAAVDTRALDPARGVFSPYSAEFAAWFKSVFHNRRTAIRCDLISQVEHFMRALGFWSIVPYSVATIVADGTELAMYDITLSPPDRMIYYAVKSGEKKPLVQRFLADLTDELRAEQAGYLHVIET